MNINLILLATGLFCSLIWGFVTLMSLGIPPSWVAAIDRFTFQAFSPSVERMANGFYYDIDNNDMPTVAFLFLFFVSFALVVWVFYFVRRSAPSRGTIPIILGIAVLLRLLVLPGELIHENDIYRYLWDGKTFVHGINPYKYAPSDLFMLEHNRTKDYYNREHKKIYRARPFSPEEQGQVRALISLRDCNPVYFERIGHSQVPTIYPPVMQVLFALAAAVRTDSIAVMKGVFFLFDLGTIVLITRLLRHFHLSPVGAVLYAFSPLVLKEFPNGGHGDPAAIFFMLLGIYGILKKRTGWGMAALALAFLSKFFAVILLPVVAHRLKPRDWGIFLAVILAAYLPFFFWNGAGVKGVFQGLMTYHQYWMYNASGFAVIYALMKTVSPVWVKTLLLPKAVAGIILAGIAASLAIRPAKDDWTLVHRCFLAVAALFFLSPVGDPWYFAWVLPFLCLFPYPSLVLLSGMLVLSYLNFRSDVPWIDAEIFYIPLLSWVIYLPCLAVLIMEKFIGLHQMKGSDYNGNGAQP